jgi:ribokinase
MINYVSPIISIGDLVADLIVSIPGLPAEAGQHQVAQEIRLEPGGGANFLIAGARLGVPMAAIGALGNDDWGHRVAEIIRAEGIDMTGVRHSGTTTLVIVLVGQGGEHVFLGQYGHSEPVNLRPADVEQLKTCGAVFCAGYTLNENHLLDMAIEAMRLARLHHRPVFFDPGPQMVDVPKYIRRELLPLVNTLLLTEDEIPLLTAGGAADLLDSGPEMIVVKQGAAGCTLYRRGRAPVKAPGYPVTIKDTSAAGDSFNAAFITATQWGWSPAECAQLANAVGAAKVQKLGGGRSVPTRANVQAVIDQFDIRIKLPD